MFQNHTNMTCNVVAVKMQGERLKEPTTGIQWHKNLT